MNSKKEYEVKIRKLSKELSKTEKKMAGIESGAKKAAANIERSKKADEGIDGQP